MACDYRKMLLAYIELVGDREGVDFLGDGPSCDIDDEFTEEESVEMAKLRDIGRIPEMRYYDQDGVPIRGLKA